MHRSCFLAWHGQREHGGGGSGGYSGGYGPPAGHRKEGILCEVSKPPFTPEVTSRKALCSLDDFLVVEMFINEGSYSTSDGQVESEDSAAFLHQETPLFSVNQRLLRCLHHASWCNQFPIVAVVFNSTLAPFQTSSTWNCEQLRGVSATFERERDFFVLFYCNTQSYCIRERFVSLSYAWI